MAQPSMVKALRILGYEVYDFRNPGPGETGFQWTEIDPEWESWSVRAFAAGLKTPVADHGFSLDLEGMDQADACILLLPCGRSAHSEAGYMAGMGKPVIVYTMSECEPELMYKLFYGVTDLLSQVVEWLQAIQRELEDAETGETSKGPGA